MANGISNIYKSNTVKVRSRKGDKIRLKDSHKRYNQECGECKVIRKVPMTPEQNDSKPLTPEQKVAKASFLKFFSRHLALARVSENPTLSKGAFVNAKFIPLRTMKW